jgi:psiF repeat
MIGFLAAGAARYGRHDSVTKTLALATLILAIAGAPTLAYAQASSCSAQATDKKLAGAAKTSFMKKCVKDSCDGQAADKKLAGAAKTSFTTKCVKDGMSS